MERFERLDAVALPISQVNCDTDQIIPAEFLQKPRSDNFGNYLFHALRFRANGTKNPDFILNQPAYLPSRILVAERNFGCGSSREHAVWALHDYGFRAIIAASFGDIFFVNCLKNGLLPIVQPADKVTALIGEILAHPGLTLAVDLPAQTLTLPDGSTRIFAVDSFSKNCLVNGLDELGYTMSLGGAIDAFEREYPSF